MSRRRFGSSDPNRVPAPLDGRPPRRDPTLSRQPCPACATPDSEILFQQVCCHNSMCRHYCATLEASAEEVDRRRMEAIRHWASGRDAGP